MKVIDRLIAVRGRFTFSLMLYPTLIHSAFSLYFAFIDRLSLDKYA